MKLNQNLKIFLIGIMAGFISGFFSSGGGMILVPSFIYILDLNEKEARATSIFCILPMVIISCFFYLNKNCIQWNIATLCAIGGIIGGYIGTRIIKKIPDRILKIFFICFLLYCSSKSII